MLRLFCRVNVRLIKLLLYMNAVNKDGQCLSPKEEDEMAQGMKELIIRLAFEEVRASQNTFSPQTYATILSKLTQINLNNSILTFLQDFIATVFSFATNSHPQWSQKITSRDYQILQKALQKSQEQIRKHYKVQQQLKIYLDSLEDKIQQLEDKLELETQKYLLLFQTFKELDQNHQKLIQQLNHPTNQPLNTFFNPANTIQTASHQNMAARKTKLGLKSKIIMERLQQRTRKINQNNKNKMLNITDDDIHLKSYNHIILKRKSIDRYQNKQNNSQLKELTKSLQMKQGHSIESYKRKVSKTRTQANNRQRRFNTIIS